jgi:hypothetical protein
LRFHRHRRERLGRGPGTGFTVEEDAAPGLRRGRPASDRSRPWLRFPTQRGTP